MLLVLFFCNEIATGEFNGITGVFAGCDDSDDIIAGAFACNFIAD